MTRPLHQHTDTRFRFENHWSLGVLLMSWKEPVGRFLSPPLLEGLSYFLCNLIYFV